MKSVLLSYSAHSTAQWHSVKSHSLQRQIGIYLYDDVTRRENPFLSKFKLSFAKVHDCDGCYVYIFGSKAKMTERNRGSLPSQVTTDPWIYISSPKNDGKLPEKAGCWILYHNKHVERTGGVSSHDEAWKIIRALVSKPTNTVILSAKGSTSWEERVAGRLSIHGLICCYTNDYKDISSIKKAAIAIRGEYKYPGNMFYKRDSHTHEIVEQSEDSRRKTFHVVRHKNVAWYKFSENKEFFQRDILNGDWLLLENI